MSPLIRNSSSLAEFMSQHLELRQSKNPSYSVRAFARDMGMSASQMSGILRGREGLSKAKAEAISKKLRLKTRDKNFFLDLILASKGKTESIRLEASKRILAQKKQEKVHQLKEDEFKLIADWYYAAIPELLKLKNFTATAESIAEYLGITLSQAEEALLRLERLQLIHQKSNRWVPSDKPVAIQNEIPSSAIRRAHRQILEKAIYAILEGHPSERTMMSTILAMPESALQEMNEKIAQIAMETYEKYKQAPKERLFAFSLQLFPVQARRKS